MKGDARRPGEWSFVGGGGWKSGLQTWEPQASPSPTLCPFTALKPSEHPSSVSAQLLQLCPALCDPMDCSLPGSSIHGILQARILKWVAMASSRGSPQPRDGIHTSYVPCISGRFFTTSATWGLYLWISQRPEHKKMRTNVYHSGQPSKFPYFKFLT